MEMTIRIHDQYIYRHIQYVHIYSKHVRAPSLCSCICRLCLDILGGHRYMGDDRVPRMCGPLNASALLRSAWVAVHGHLFADLCTLLCCFMFGSGGGALEVYLVD
jgi:hypothetical protein